MYRNLLTAMIVGTLPLTAMAGHPECGGTPVAPSVQRCPDGSLPMFVADPIRSTPPSPRADSGRGNASGAGTAGMFGTNWALHVPGAVYQTDDVAAGTRTLHTSTGTGDLPHLLRIDASGSYEWRAYGEVIRGRWTSGDADYPVVLQRGYEGKNWRATMKDGGLLLWDGKSLAGQFQGRAVAAVAPSAAPAAAGPAPADGRDALDDARRKATEAMKARRFDEALQQYDVALEGLKSSLGDHPDREAARQVMPLTQELLFNRSMAALQLGGQEVRAVQDLTAMLKASQVVDADVVRDANAYSLRGYAQLGLGRWRDAEQDLSRAMQMHGAEAELTFKGRSMRSYRGDAHFNLGELDAAIADYSEALRHEGGDRAARVNRALAYEQRGSHDQALSDLQGVINLKIDPLPQTRDVPSHLECQGQVVPEGTHKCPNGDLPMFVARSVRPFTPQEIERMRANTNAAAASLARRLSPNGGALNLAQVEQLRTMNCLISAAYNSDVTCVQR